MRSVYMKISLWSVAILLCSALLFLLIARDNVYRIFAKDGQLGGGYGRNWRLRGRCTKLRAERP